MLYRERPKRRPLAGWLRHSLAGLGATSARRRRTDLDLRQLSPYLRRDLGLMDGGYPY